MIPRRRLAGRSVAVLGLGGAGFLMDRHRAVSDQEVRRILGTAVASGIDVFDTAPFYDSGRAHSEERLAHLTSIAPRALVATKVGMYPGHPQPVFRYDADSVRRSVSRSLERLGKDRLDLVQLHELTHERWDAAFAQSGAVRALSALRDEGVIGAVGVSGSDVKVLTRAASMDCFDSIQIWRRWNLLDSSGEKLLTAADARSIDVIVGGPFASGILATGSAAPGEFQYAPATRAELERVRRLERACNERGLGLRSAALAFCLHPAVSVVLTGVDSADQLRANVSAVCNLPARASVLEAIDQAS